MKPTISAWMDGECDEQGRPHDPARTVADDELRNAWTTYHLIGDAMRGLPALSPRFTARLLERLEAEPVVLAPQRARVPATRVRRTVLSLAASFAGVALVGWLAFAPLSGRSPDTAPAALASKAPVPPARDTASAVPPAGTTDYMLAHQAYSPGMRLQGIASYARTVSDGNARRGAR